MIKLTNSMLDNRHFRTGIEALCSSKSDTLTGKEVYDILRLSKEISSRLTDYNVSKKKLFETYGKETDKNKWVFEGANQNIIQEKILELNIVEFTVECDKILYSSNFILSAAEMGALEDSGILDLSSLKNN